MAEVQALVLFEGLPLIDGKQLVNDLGWRWPEVGNPQHLVRGEQEVGFALGEAAVLMVNVDAQIDYADFPERHVSERFWPGSINGLMRHQSHMVISVNLENRRGTDLFQLATKVTASALAAAPSALGVYWPSTPQLINRESFLARASSLPSLPLELWINITVGKGRDGSVTASTSGLEAFGLRELEMVDSPESREAARIRLTNLVSQMLRQRRNLSHGVTLGYDHMWKVEVEVAPSKLGGTGDVSQIVFEAATDQAIIDASAQANA
jgi:hypothetical protein